MTPIDNSQYFAGVAARNSSHQITETMALHQTIKAQVEETVELHKTIQQQISVTNQQGRLIWRLSIAVAVLTLVQAVGTVIQVRPAFQKPEEARRSKPSVQDSKEQGNPVPNDLRQAPSSTKSPTTSRAGEGALREKAATSTSP